MSNMGTHKDCVTPCTGRSEGVPLAAYFVPGAMGWGSGQLQKLFRRGRRPAPAMEGSLVLGFFTPLKLGGQI